MKTILFTTLLAINSAFSGGEVTVPTDRLTISSSKHKLEVTVVQKPKEQASITVIHEGNTLEIAKVVMTQFPHIDLLSVRILTHTQGGIPDKWLKEHAYIIRFNYGSAKIHGQKGKEVKVYSIGRLHCQKASYLGLEKFIPEGDFKNRWKIYMPMMFEEGDGFNGTSKGIKNP